MTNWLQLRLLTSPAQAELCSQVLLDAGCAGVQVNDTIVRIDESEDATLEARDEVELLAYVDEVQLSDAMRGEIEEGLRAVGIATQLEVERIADADWSNSWRENFPPLSIGPFIVAPPWEEIADNGSIVIRIDPGLAFGTGQHPTTRLCLELLAKNIVAGQSVFDVGCGSGILSIAAAKLRAEVVASDLDPFCAAATRDNAEANGVSLEVVQTAGAAWSGRQYDVVIANLMSALLIQLAPELAGATRPGGTLIVSGISEPRADEVESALNGAGFRTVERHIQDGEERGDYVERWAAFVLVKGDREIAR